MNASFSAISWIRYVVAYVFITSGIMKLVSSEIARNFLSLDLPFPKYLLYVVIILEIGCGILIIFEHKVKQAVIPLMAIMIGAILLTKVPTLHSGFFHFAFQARLDIVMFVLLVILYYKYPK